MKKYFLLLIIVLFNISISFADTPQNSHNQLSTFIANYTSEVQTDQNKTILSTLSKEDQTKAEIDYKKGKKHYYDLGSKAPGGLSALFKSPTLFVIATPYSLYRNEIYNEKQKFIPFTNEEKNNLINRREVYIQAFSNPYFGVPTLIENMVIKKDGEIYHGRPMELDTTEFRKMLETGYSNIYAFDIDLFDGKDMDLIAINASNDNQITIHITSETFKKHNWY